VVFLTLLAITTREQKPDERSNAKSDPDAFISVFLNGFVSGFGARNNFAAGTISPFPALIEESAEFISHFCRISIHFWNLRIAVQILNHFVFEVLTSIRSYFRGLLTFSFSWLNAMAVTVKVPVFLKILRRP
jgi:hypothetical protein